MLLGLCLLEFVVVCLWVAGFYCWLGFVLGLTVIWACLDDWFVGLGLFCWVWLPGFGLTFGFVLLLLFGCLLVVSLGFGV